MEIPFTVKDRPDTGLFNSKIGIWLFLASEVMLFGGLFSGYVFLRLDADYPWPIHALQATMKLGATNTAILILSSVTVVMAWTALKLHRWREFQLWMTITVLCAMGFCVIKTIEYSSKFKHYAVVLKDGTELHGHLEEHDPRFPGDDYVMTLSQVGIKTYHPQTFDPGSLVKLDQKLRSGEGDENKKRRLHDASAAALGRELAGIDEVLAKRAVAGLLDLRYLNGEVSPQLLAARRKSEEEVADLGRQTATIARNLQIGVKVSDATYHRAKMLTPVEQGRLSDGSADDALKAQAAEFELHRRVRQLLGSPLMDASALQVVSVTTAGENSDPQPTPLEGFHFGPRESKLQFPGGFILFDGYTLMGQVPPQFVYMHYVDVIDIRRVAEQSADLADLDQTIVGRVPELREAWEHHWEHIREGEQKRAKSSDGETRERPFSDYHRFTIHLLKKDDYVTFHTPEALGAAPAHGSGDAAAHGDHSEPAPAPSTDGATTVASRPAHPAEPAAAAAEGAAAPEPAGEVAHAAEVGHEGGDAAADAHGDAHSVAHGDAHGGGEHGHHHPLAIPRDQIQHGSFLTPRFNTFYSIYYLMTSLHALHVVGGALVLAYFLIFGKKLYDKDPDHLANRVEVGGLFWHFVDLVWIFLFPLLYLL